MQTIWFGHAFGARCWADVTATIKPAIALAYWRHLEAGRLEEAKGYIDRYDRPYQIPKNLLKPCKIGKDLLSYTTYFLTVRNHA